MNIKEKDCIQTLFFLLLHLLRLKHNNSGRKNIFFFLLSTLGVFRQVQQDRIAAGLGQTLGHGKTGGQMAETVPETVP